MHTHQARSGFSKDPTILSPLAWMLRSLLVVLICLGPAIPGFPASFPAAAAWADSQPQQRIYRCDGEPLSAELVPGAVDALGIPNTLAGTVPGAYQVLRWRGVQLQLPRTNNAGAPSFSDGKWAWSELDPDHPILRLRSGGGDVREFRCDAQS
jgi:hypothetical protein